MFRLCVCVSLDLCVYMSAVPCGGQKEESDPLELELQAVLSCPVWVLGTELGSSAISPVPKRSSKVQIQGSFKIFISLPDVNIYITFCNLSLMCALCFST